MARLPRKMKFASLHNDCPSPDEPEERFIDRMGALGNRAALEKLEQLKTVKGMTYPLARAEMRLEQGLM